VESDKEDEELSSSKPLEIFRRKVSQKRKTDAN